MKVTPVGLPHTDCENPDGGKLLIKRDSGDFPFPAQGHPIRRRLSM